MHKHTMTDASAKRICEVLALNPAKITYETIIQAIRDEGFNGGRSQMIDFIKALQSCGRQEMAIMVGMEAVRSERRHFEKVRDIQAGFRALGVTFEDDE